MREQNLILHREKQTENLKRVKKEKSNFPHRKGK